MKNMEIKKLIGDLEMMAAASEPGVVITEEMSLSCSMTLLKAVKELRKVTFERDVSKKSSL
ncbi:hypothetical protein [Vibrio parahaemolyticus]|uniref:hypothetical protein n=1 Tax=Vibrio parahaemolyticus TaxID=670 RepID=UPI0025526E77|nr:hypothetical protein [Vibrio parahaemolyticus]MDL1992999.1 hypothetical protein [Vibrio parahaemolyticus]